MGIRGIGLRDVHEVGLAQARQMNRHANRIERLVGTDVAGSFVARNVLLTVFLDQRITQLAVQVMHTPDQATRQKTLQRFGTGNDANIRPARTQRQAQRLAFTHDDIGTQLARRFKPAAKQRIDAGSQQHSGLFAGARDRRDVFNHAQCIRALQHDTGYIAGSQQGRHSSSIYQASLRMVGNVVHRDAPRFEVSCQNFAVLRPQGFGHDNAALAAGRAHHPAGFSQRRRTVVHRTVHAILAKQTANQYLEFKQRLQQALAHLRLVRCVGGQKLTARHHRVNYSGNVVLIGTTAQEAGMRQGGTVFGSHGAHVAHQFPFAQRGGHIEFAAQAHLRRHISKQLLYGIQPHGCQHGLDVGAGMDVVAKRLLLHDGFILSLIHVCPTR